MITLPALLGPTSVQVLLALALRLFGDVFRNLAALDLRVFLSAITLLGSLNEAGVDDLAATGNQAQVA
ncbi:hypothetical protein JIN80_17660 [Cerasicoccus arenae]|nr:hypothetical protein [Cerasicoccus arenae]